MAAINLRVSFPVVPPSLLPRCLLPMSCLLTLAMMSSTGWQHLIAITIDAYGTCHMISVAIGMRGRIDAIESARGLLAIPSMLLVLVLMLGLLLLLL